MNISSIQPLNTKYLRTAYAAIVTSVLLIASFSAVGIAYADKSTPISGDWEFLSGVTLDTRITESGILHRDSISVFEITGDIDGEWVGEVTVIIDLNTGRGTYHGSGPFTGTILGSPVGQAILNTDCIIRNSGTPQLASDCHQTVSRGTNGLSGVHVEARGGFTGDPADLPLAPYSGWAHFDHS